MNIAFLAPGILQKEGGGTADMSHTNYLIPGAELMTEQQEKPQMNADERRLIILVQHPRKRTRMTQIARIFTDTFYPCASVSFVQSVFNRFQSAFNHIPAPCERIGRLLYYCASRGWAE
jgi:hypothetical protein